MGAQKTCRNWRKRARGARGKPLTAEADPGDLGIMGDPDDRGQEWDGEGGGGGGEGRHAKQTLNFSVCVCVR